MERVRDAHKGWTAVAAAFAVAVAVAIPFAVRAGGGGTTAGKNSTGAADRAALQLGPLDQGEPPATGYLSGQTFVTPSGGRVRLGVPSTETPLEVAALDGGYLVASSAENEDASARFFADDGGVLGPWPVAEENVYPPFAKSPDSKFGVFIQGVSGAPVVVSGRGETTELPRLADASDVGQAPVAVSGTDCGPMATATSCTVIAHAYGNGGGPNTRVMTWRVAPGKNPVPADLGIGTVQALAPDGHVAGTTRITDDGDGACAAVADPSKKILWSTCSDQLLDFAPNSRYVVGTTSAIFGFGFFRVRVYEVNTGRVVLNLKTPDRYTGVHQMRWEDDTHLLLLVSQGTPNPKTQELEHMRWAVLRLAVNGHREYAVAPTAQKVDFRSPLLIPVG